MAVDDTRSIAKARSPRCDSRSPTKKLGSWGSGTKNSTMVLDKMLEEFEERRIETLERGMLDPTTTWATIIMMNMMIGS